jgi:hypothetical protein
VTAQSNKSVAIGKKKQDVIYPFGQSTWVEKYFRSITKMALGLQPRVVFETSGKYFSI